MTAWLHGQRPSCPAHVVIQLHAVQRKDSCALRNDAEPAQCDAGTLARWCASCSIPRRGRAPSILTASTRAPRCSRSDSFCGRTRSPTGASPSTMQCASCSQSSLGWSSVPSTGASAPEGEICFQSLLILQRACFLLLGCQGVPHLSIPCCLSGHFLKSTMQELLPLLSGCHVTAVPPQAVACIVRRRQRYWHEEQLLLIQAPCNKHVCVWHHPCSRVPYEGMQAACMKSSICTSTRCIQYSPPALS